MLLLLSPAKSLDYESPIPAVPLRRPAFVPEAEALVAALRERSVPQLQALMDISPALAELNAARYAAWRPRFTARNSRPAVLAFDGDVYGGLEARSLDADALAWADEHLAILSGLYGLLRPLDALQPYRLEMGVALPNARGPNLYAYWQDTLARVLNRRVRAQAAPVLVNLASQEYFKAVPVERLKVPVLQCVFEDWSGGEWKVLGLFAKRARGLMARHVIDHRIDTPQGLEDFDREGYRLDRTASSADRLVFRRKEKTT
ncbi:peroxide stress protein YaaA [Piscinibacter sakaiensis]|uniref:UPF0246 protein ISF6_2799 n=1 Tax=Piscinibacter sakaiensis TaxID=1547922 RepID=A0A0K8P338_PISS1|nr:peroxide stress protein YaaA [Piscinibacter sakaiensis]GAP36944.1 UPF0246 protein YaaA [Piscinibacter sakaiensis]